MLSTMAPKPFMVTSVKGDRPNAVHHGSVAILCLFLLKEITPMLSTMAPKPFYAYFC